MQICHSQLCVSNDTAKTKVAGKVADFIFMRANTVSSSSSGKSETVMCRSNFIREVLLIRKYRKITLKFLIIEGVFFVPHRLLVTLGLRYGNLCRM